VVGESPQIDIRAASEYRRRTEKVLKQGGVAEQKRLLRTWVSEVTLAPEQQQVEMTYRIPEPIMNGLVAGAGFWRLLILLDEPVVELRRGKGGTVVAAASVPAGRATPDPAHTDVAQAAVGARYAGPIR